MTATLPEDAVGIGAATELPPCAPLSTTLDYADGAEVERLRVRLAEEVAARVAVEEEREALAASLRERSTQLLEARRGLEVSRALRATQADTIRGLAAELDALAPVPVRARRDRQNTRRRVERVCAAMAKHLARRATR